MDILPRNFNKYQYETSPRKLEPYYAPNKKITQTKKQNKKNTVKKQKEELKLKAKL